jgi:splicing factor U2AF subunit
MDYKERKNFHENANIPPIPHHIQKDDSYPNAAVEYRSYTPDSCSFWDKVGACRHGNKCAKYHNKPKRSRTVVFWKIYRNPVRTYFTRNKEGGSDVALGEFVKTNVEIDEERLRKEATRLYQDLFVELALKYGEIESILICGNYNPHIGGNALVKFKDERSASKCFRECNDRWYNGQPIFCELSPVQHFDDAICKEFAAKGRCERGDQCNLIHPRKPPSELKRMLYASQQAHFKAQEM